MTKYETSNDTQTEGTIKELMGDLGIESKETVQQPPATTDFFEEESLDLTSYSKDLDEKKHLPSSFKIGRMFEINRPQAELFIFSSLEEKPDENITYLKNIGKNVSLLTIRQINFVLGKLLYNKSYLCDNRDQNTGLSKDGRFSDGSRCAFYIEKDGQKYYHGEINVKLSELAAEVFGKDSADNRQKREVLYTLRAMQNIYLEDNEKFGGMQLLNIPAYTIDKVTGAKILKILLHPIYAMDVTKNFGAHPQGILKKLSKSVGRVTLAQMALLSLLGMQDKRKPFVIYATLLLTKLGLYDSFRKNRKRAIKQLDSAIEAMIKCEIIKEKPTVTTGETGELAYMFILNPDYAKTDNSPFETIPNK